MQKNSFMKKVASGVLAGGMLLSLTTVVWADDASDTSLQRTSPMYQRMGANNQKMGNQNFGKNFDFGHKKGVMGGDVLKKLVESGDISQDKADQISTIIKERTAEREEHQQEMKEKVIAHKEELKDMTPEERREYMKSLFEEYGFEEKQPLFQELVDEGILSDSEVEVIRTKVRECNEAQNKERQNTRWENLVEKEIITSDEKEEALEYLKEKAEERRAERQAEWEKIKNMTTEERREYKQEKIEARKLEGRGSMLAELVEEGIVTQDQADKIQELNKNNRADLRGKRINKGGKAHNGVRHIRGK